MAESDGETKVCPQCAEEVRSAATRCRFCGYDFEGAQEGEEQKKRSIPAAWFLVGAVLITGLLVAGAVVWASNRSKSSDEPKPAATFHITGTLTAPECGGGYEITFANVEVRDQNDKLIGSTTTGGNEGSGRCSVSFETVVPKATFYQFTIGSHGGPAYTFEEMQDQDWNLDLSLS